MQAQVARSTRAEERSLLAAFQDSLARFCQDRVNAQVIDAKGEIGPEVLTALGELGVFGVSIPSRYGGSELGLRGACAVVEVLARHDRSVATTAGLHLGLGTRGLVAFASPEQKLLLLPRLASGEDIAAFSTTEPAAGSDLSALRTILQDAAPGRVRVSGHKIFVTNARLARVFTVAASSPGRGEAKRGQSLVVLYPDDPGFRIGAEEHKLGLKGSSTCELFFEDVDVPASRVIGHAGAGADYLNHVLAWGRTIMSAGCNGTSHTALRLAAQHVVERRQFGRTLAAQPIVRAQLADMAAALFAARALVEGAAEVADDAEMLERRSLAAKVFCSQASGQICDTALQLHGGLGYIEEGGLALLVRDTRVTRIFEGANDVLLTRLGMLALTSPGSVDVPNSTAAAFAARCRAELRARGLRALRDKRQLHRFGVLTMLAETVRAATSRAASGGRREQDLAAHWRHVARRRAEALSLPGGPDVTTDLVAEALFEGGIA